MSNCSKRANSPCATMFSTFFSNYTYNYRDFLYFSVDIVKVVFCRFVVCGNGITYNFPGYVTSFNSVFFLLACPALHLEESIANFRYMKITNIELGSQQFNPFPHIDAFWRLCSRRLFENIVTKEEFAQNEQFLLLPWCFPLFVVGYPFNYGDILCFDKICSKSSAAELSYGGKG